MLLEFIKVLTLKGCFSYYILKGDGMKKWKLSQYNILYNKDNRKYILNTATGAIGELDENNKKNFDNNNNLVCLQKEVLETGIEEGFIVPSDLDEKKLIELNYLKAQFNDEYLGIVISPTMQCNFACPYCFEPRIKDKMSSKTQDDLISFIELHMKKGIKHLDVTWYGGEPLIYKDIINNLTKKIKKLTVGYNVKYSAYIITNGYLISDDDKLFFNKNDIRGAQITIDGPPEVHDTRRILKSGGPTFNKLIENIKRLLLFGVDVSIRVNVDKTNERYLEQLLQILNQEKLNECRLALGHVQSYTPICQSISPNCVTKKKFRLLEYEFSQLLKKYNFNDPLTKVMLEPKNIYCGAVMKNYYVVDTDGYLYKCWNDISIHEKAVGKLGETQTEQMKLNEAKYLTWNPCHIHKCEKCKELPLCMGGCPFMAEILKKPLCEHKLYGLPKYIDLQIVEGGEKVENY